MLKLKVVSLLSSKREHQVEDNSPVNPLVLSVIILLFVLGDAGDQQSAHLVRSCKKKVCNCCYCSKNLNWSPPKTETFNIDEETCITESVEDLWKADYLCFFFPILTMVINGRDWLTMDVSATPLIYLGRSRNSSLLPSPPSISYTISYQSSISKGMLNHATILEY